VTCWQSRCDAVLRASPPGTCPAAIIENNAVNGNLESRNNTPVAAVSGTVGGTTVTR